MKHSEYMEIALCEARKAFSLGEVPVGAIIVKEGEIISSGYNRRETDKNALGHAEIMAIDAACKELSSWRLLGCTLYVTLEPCPMCMGAIINSRIEKLVFGALDTRAGCCGSVIDLSGQIFSHKMEIIAGINEYNCQKLLTDFFVKLR